MLNIEATAATLSNLFGTGQSLPLLTSTHPSLDLPGAYQVPDAVRKKRLVRDGPVVGRKIGFTNHRMWETYGVKAPIWGYMYEGTVRLIENGARVSLSGFPEPKIEPEIFFGAPRRSAAGDGLGRASRMHWVRCARLRNGLLDLLWMAV